MALSDRETATPACAPPDSPLPLEELSLPLTGAVAALLARCDILGFLLARGSIKSAAGRFWQKKKKLFQRQNLKTDLGINSSHLRVSKSMTEQAKMV